MIQPRFTPTDDVAFQRLVTNTADAMAGRIAPSDLYVLRLDNWFDAKWVDFSGKSLGAVGCREPNLTLPPFVPNRIESQERWTRKNGEYVSVDPGEPWHRRQPSDHYRQRRLAELAPGASFVWYSGNTASNRRGSMMIYAADGDGYWRWYVGLRNDGDWKPVLLKGIAETELAALWKQASPSGAA